MRERTHLPLLNGLSIVLLMRGVVQLGCQTIGDELREKQISVKRLAVLKRKL
jgi:hypothetical protein